MTSREQPFRSHVRNHLCYIPTCHCAVPPSPLPLVPPPRAASRRAAFLVRRMVPSGARPSAESAGRNTSFRVKMRRALEHNRQQVAEFAGGGGGTAAHRAEQTTRGHIWLLPADSPLRRPWRANMVARPVTAATTSDTSLKLSEPLNESQLAALRQKCALLSASSIPADDCAICYMPMVLAADGRPMAAHSCIVRLPCGGGHTFHFRCINPWLRKARLCPTCRQTLKVVVPPVGERRPQTQVKPLPPLGPQRQYGGRTSGAAQLRDERAPSRMSCTSRAWR